MENNNRDCFVDRPLSYFGKAFKTMTGTICEKWSDPRIKPYQHDDNLVEKLRQELIAAEGSADHRFCRNSHLVGDANNRPWCYVESSFRVQQKTTNHSRWEYCQVKKCQPCPATIPNGMIAHQCSRDPGKSPCTYSCHHGYTPTMSGIICQQNGQWDAEVHSLCRATSPVVSSATKTGADNGTNTVLLAAVATGAAVFLIALILVLLVLCKYIRKFNSQNSPSRSNSAQSVQFTMPNHVQFVPNSAGADISAPPSYPSSQDGSIVPGTLYKVPSGIAIAYSGANGGGATSHGSLYFTNYNNDKSSDDGSRRSITLNKRGSYSHDRRERKGHPRRTLSDIALNNNRHRYSGGPARYGSHEWASNDMYFVPEEVDFEAEEKETMENKINDSMTDVHNTNV